MTLPGQHPAQRCAAHPGRLAVDLCPVCDRPRCGADTSLPGCTICGGVADAVVAEQSRRRPPGRLERLVAAGVAGHLVAFAWGEVSSEYIGAPVFRYVSPLILGVLAGIACTGAAGTSGRSPLARARFGRTVQAVSVLYAVLGTGISLLAEGTYSALSTSGAALSSYAIAAVAALVWTQPPRPRARVQRGSGTSE